MKEDGKLAIKIPAETGIKFQCSPHQKGHNGRNCSSHAVVRIEARKDV